MTEGTLQVENTAVLVLGAGSSPAFKDLRIFAALSGTDVHLNEAGIGCVEVHGGLLDLTGTTLHMSLGQTLAGANSPCATQDAFSMLAASVEVRLTGTALVLEQSGPVEGEVFLFISSGMANYVGEFVGLPDGSPIELPGGEVKTISYSSSFAGAASGSDISLIPAPAPVAVADSGYVVFLPDVLTVFRDDGLLANDVFSFPNDGNFVTVIAGSVTQPLFGTVVVSPDGAFTYTPTGGFAVNDQFAYRIEDNFGLVSNSATVTLSLMIPPTNTAAATPSETAVPSTSAVASPTPAPTTSVSTSRSRGPNIGPSQLPSPGTVGASPLPPSTPPPSNTPAASRTPSRAPQDICQIDSANVLCVDDEPVLTVLGPDVVISDPDPDVIRQVDNDDVVSLVLDVTPSGGYRPGDEAVLCFAITEDLQEDSCLGFINEDKNPPEWECEDSCVEANDGRACGTTRHFTNFAILLDGGKYGGSACGSSDEDFIFDEWWQDLLLIQGLVVAVTCCLVLVAAFFCTPVGATILYGKEGTRIRKARSAGRDTNSLA